MAKRSRTIEKTLLDIPDIETLYPKRSAASKTGKKQKPGFTWRGTRYPSETALIKAVTGEVRELVRENLKPPVDVVGSDGAAYSQKLVLARLELELKDW